MTYGTYGSYSRTKDYDFEVKQDIETYIDWDVDLKIDIDLEKKINIYANADTDVKGNGADVKVVIKDIDYDGTSDPIKLVMDGVAIEDTLSESMLMAETDNVWVQATAAAYDKQATVYGTQYGKLDTGTYTEINVDVDNVAGKFTIITANLEALADG